MSRFSPLPLGRLLCLVALPWLAASPASTAATPEGLAPPGECAQARDLEIRSEPLGGTARRAADDDAVSVSGAAFRHFRAADVAAPPGVATAAKSDWLGTPAGRSISGPGPCDSPASGCRGALSLAPIVKATPRAPVRERARPAGRGKGGGGRKCD